MRKIMTGLIALAWVLLAIPMAAQADNGTVAYTPGVLKSAIAGGKTILVDYKASW